MSRPSYHLVIGEITCPDVAALFGKQLGDPEFQFSDGPAGARGTSADFPSFEAGVAALRPCRVVFKDGRVEDFD